MLIHLTDWGWFVTFPVLFVCPLSQLIVSSLFMFLLVVFTAVIRLHGILSIKPFTLR